MLLQGVKDTEFEIYHGDTLTNDWDMLRETDPAKMPKFDAVVANPPFSYRLDRRAGKAEELGVGEGLLDGLVGVVVGEQAADERVGVGVGSRP